MAYRCTIATTNPGMTMKTKLSTTRLSAAIAASLLLASLPAYADNKTDSKADLTIGTETRNVAAFSNIAVDGPLHVIITSQGSTGIELSGQRRQFAEIETSVSGDTLTVRQQRHKSKGWSFNFSWNKESKPPVTVRISAATLKSLRNSGSGDVELQNVQTQQLTVNSDGSGDIYASGNVRDLTVTASGSGDLRLRALKAGSLNLLMNGAGDVSAAGMTQEVNLTMNGSGDLQLDDLHTSRISAVLHGSGSAVLRGSSADLRAELSGSGDLDACTLNTEAASAILRGPGEACIAGSIKKFEGEVRGSGDLTVRGLQAASARVLLTGPGNMELSGSVGQLNAELSGSGDLEGQSLQVTRAIARSRGPGNIYLSRVSETLDAELSGSGDLSATAACKNVKLSMQGPGDIKLDGRTEQLTAQVNGSGSLNARQLLAQQAEVNVRGPGNAVVNLNGKGEHPQLITYERRGQRSTQ
jgi:hypothetical protein